MKLFEIVVCAALFCGVDARAIAGPLPAEPAAEIRAALDEMLAAANAHDVDRYMKLYTRTPDLVVIFDDMKITGWQAARDQQAQWWNDGKIEVTYRLRSPVEISRVNAEVFVTLQRLAATAPAADGTHKTQNLDVTSIWRKTGNDWRICVAHESFVP